MVNKLLKNKILIMVKKDQGVRINRKLWKNVEKIDKRNTLEMKKIIKKYGWPGISLVGKKASMGAWLLIQHADRNLIFQKKCLELVRRAVRQNEIEKKYLAYLIDRINVNEDKPQVFGTQFYTNKNGEFTTRPIKDKKNLTKRRKKFGLPPFQKYKNFLLQRHQIYNKK
jgi:hypothetical protein